MEDLQIRRRRIGRGRIAQAWQKLNIASRQRDPLDRGDDRQIEMEVNSLLMIEGDLVAIAARAVFDRSFRFAMPIRTAAALRLSEHEVLFAGNAAAPEQGGDKQQRKKRTGERPRQFSLSIAIGPGATGVRCGGRRQRVFCAG